MTPELVIAGNLLLDDIVLPDGRTRMAEPGGAALHAALAAALWGVRVGCVSVVGADYPAAALDALRARGVDLDGVRTSERPSLRTWLLYEGGLRRVVHRLAGTPHADVCPVPADLPGAWRTTRALHLAPMPLACQAPWLAALGAQPNLLLSLDPYELLTAESLDAWRPVIAAVDLFAASEDDLRLPGADADPEPAMTALASGRLRWLACKRGAAGGLLRDVHAGRTHAWGARATRVVDPTGAGDAFAAGVLAALVRGMDAEAALARGVVSASFAIEDWGVAGLLAATRDEAGRRLAAWYPKAVVA